MVKTSWTCSMSKTSKRKLTTKETMKLEGNKEVEKSLPHFETGINIVKFDADPDPGDTTREGSPSSN